ncbi:oxidoreductase [Pseudovirgaria hyperparasitica]|uniref:Oxidoreductase n=1 Tax=Pseudovirgaria hyperparasitica TaxID=470096 RepID=A0A6A6WC25_9PEZI|nr:oxidoreductase [Pseudovirgaria hyperparasitica]KAF2759510.1 oxidoreductase [Pseudovirgaria hyperparasitica]
MAAASAPKLEGKVAIVTGGAAGFGAQIAKTFVANGAKVLITDINEDAGAKTAASESSSSLKFFRHDVTSADDWKATLEYAVKEFGHVDILVNNAGGTYKMKPTLEVTEKDWEFVFNLNVKSIFHGSNTLVPHFIERGKGGSVVNIASVGASRPRPGLVWYNSTKGAVVNATKGLASEYGPHQIRFNSVAPLLTGTGLFSSFVGVEDTPENRESFNKQVPLGRLGEVQDTANAVLWLASDDAKFITGINIKVDGGKCI